MHINLSEGEWKLMKWLWQRAPMTITELTAALREETGWSKHTVITMLSRLEGKGAVGHRAGERAKEYSPRICQEAAIYAESESFLDKVGGLGLLVSTMAERNALTQADLKELSAILEQAGEKK